MLAPSGLRASCSPKRRARPSACARRGGAPAAFPSAASGRARDALANFAAGSEASHTALSVTPHTARIAFEQTWAAGDYRDVGPKQIVVVTSPDGPRIAREEMLSSTVAGADAHAKLTDLRLVTDQGIILNSDPHENWASGKSIPGKQENVALRGVDEAQLPAELRAWKGRNVRVLGESRTSCEAKVIGFQLRAEVIPHFGSVQTWHGQAGEPALTPPQIAEEIWTMAQNGGRVLVGKLAPSCPGLWALDAERAAPLAAAPAPEPADSELSARALRAARTLPDYANIQKSFEQTAESPKGRWEEYSNHATRVTAFRFAGQLKLVDVMMSAGNGCGDFEGTLTALYAIRKGTADELQYLGPGSSLTPSSAFDLDADGSLELLYGNAHDGGGARLWRKTATGVSLEELFGVPFLDCGC